MAGADGYDSARSAGREAGEGGVGLAAFEELTANDPGQVGRYRIVARPGGGGMGQMSERFRQLVRLIRAGQNGDAPQ